MLSTVLRQSKLIERQIVCPKSFNGIVLRSYHEIIIDHYENPRNVGSLDKNKKNVGTGKR
jgi:hypothetical protein